MIKVLRKDRKRVRALEAAKQPSFGKTSMRAFLQTLPAAKEKKADKKSDRRTTVYLSDRELRPMQLSRGGGNPPLRSSGFKANLQPIDTP